MSVQTDYYNNEAVFSFTSETAFTLPSYNSRAVITLKNLSSPILTLTCFGSETIDGNSTYVVGGNSTATIVKGRSGWVVVEGSDSSITGVFTVSNSTEATIAGAGAIVTSGGVFASKAIISGSATDATSITTGGVIGAGGLGVTKALWVGGLANVAGVTTLANATDSSSSITGGTIISGGAGIAKKLYVGTTLTVTGASTLTGGVVLASQPTIYPAVGGMWQLATAGTDSACTNGTSYFVGVNILYNQTITGLAYQVGSVGGTDSVIAVLYDSAGAVVANSALAGAVVGTAAQIQSVVFLTPYAAVSGRYYASVTFNGATAKFRTYPIPGSKFIAGSEAETFGTVTAITPGTTFTADKGPLCYVY